MNIDDENNAIRATESVMRSREFLVELRRAFVVMTYPTSPEWEPALAFGRDYLERIREEGYPAETFSLLSLKIDWSGREPELLHYSLLAAKGDSYLFPREPGDSEDELTTHLRSILED